MELIAYDTQGMTVLPTETQGLLINNMLVAVGDLAGISKLEQEDRLGRSSDGRWELLEALNAARSPDEDRMSVHFTLADLRFLAKVLIEILDEDVDEGEFHSMIGTRKPDGRQLLEEIEDLIEKAARDSFPRR